ncbi:MAG: methyltransferase domain-containing protein [Chloroflexota bacterium]
MSITWLSKDEMIQRIPSILIPSYSVLDVGSGINPQSYFIPSVHIIVEPFLPYIDNIRDVRNNDPRLVYLNGTWDKVLPFLPNKSVDSVFAIDVIEHFEKEDGLKFIKEAERVARKQIAVFTPLGWYPQSYQAEKTDRWGMQGGHWQSHRSGWEPADFGDNWECICCKEYHFIDQYDHPLENPFGAFWALKTFGDTSSEYEPLISLNMFGTKDILYYIGRRITRKLRKSILRNHDTTH